MFKNTIFRRMTALVLTLALAAAAALPGLAVYPMPIQTASETEAVYLFNADTGKTILNQNADQQQYVASLTKLMTALLLLESGKDLNGEVTVPTALTQEFRDIQNANGTTMGLRIGETVRRIDLLNAMLIVSANDAASVIAYDVGGSVLDFVKQMNARAQELGCTGTNFTCATACLTTATCPPRRIWQRSPPPVRQTRPLHRWRAPPAMSCRPRTSARLSTPSAAPTA